MRRFFFVFLALFATLTTVAMPARRGKTMVTLPDGTRREVSIRGDEHCHWLVGADGREIDGTRYFSNALRRKAPVRIGGTGAKVGDMLLEGSFPTTGKCRLLALLINFANTTPTFPREQFEAMLNEQGYNGVGSFRDYYLDQSRGALDITTTVTPWITVGQAKQYYNAENTPSLIEEALKQLDSSINLHDYDNDGDGVLDGLIVIHAGEGQEASGNATDIWSHSSTIYGMQRDGVSIFRYTIEPELLHGGPSTIGVFCHEFGHNLGALDYYDTNYSSDGAYGGTGPWDLMGEGAWNGSGGTGTHPAPFTAWQRWQFGWTEPLLLTTSQHIEGMTSYEAQGESYRMDTTTEGDYYILENVQNTTPWTSDIPGHGLMVTHVIESVVRQRMMMNNINATYPQGIYTVCADAHADPAEGDPRSYGDLTSSATPFPGTRQHTELSDETLPSTHSLDGRYGYIGLRAISETPCASGGNTVSFDFIAGNAPQKPLHLAASVRGGSVCLAWDYPADKAAPVRSNIYRGSEWIGSTEGRTFVDDDCADGGLVTYGVDATYADGLTSAVARVSTRIPQQVATDFSATQRGAVLDLKWNIPSELSRCTNDLHYDIVDHSTRLLRYAHRFRAEDILPYVGQQVRSITFLPQQRSNEATYKICVWRMAADETTACAMTLPADALELVAERKVNEYSPSFLRTTPFVTRPVLEAGYDYFVGVEIVSENGLAEVVTDQAELQNGYGNLMSMNGGAWQTDPAARGNYILSATLTGNPGEEAVRCLVFDVRDEAAAEDARSLFEGWGRPYDVDADLFFPLGFTVYNDEHRLAETTGHALSVPLDKVLYADGQAAFTLVSAYKGRNESRALSATVQVDLSGIGTLTMSQAAGETSEFYDLAGRRVQTTTAHGVFVAGGRKVVY